jgi:hypothetical protein
LGPTLVLNTGIGINDLVTLSLMATGRVDVTSSNINEVVGALILDGVYQPPIFQTNILGEGSIEATEGDRGHPLND